LLTAIHRWPAVGLLVGLVTIGACTSVRQIHPSTYLEENAPSVVWVTYTDNTVVSVAEPEVRRDTLRGMLQGARVKIPLVDIQSVQAKVRDGAKTGLLLATLGIGAVSALYFLWISQSGPDGETTDCANDAVAEHPDDYPECF